MRFPTIDVDFWTLVSGEDRQRAAPETFRIPSLGERQGLQSGDAAKLIFEIESQNKFGEISRDYERMWVVVSEVAPRYFIGRLTNKPLASGDDDSGAYLMLDVEIPFLPEHVIEIDRPPEDYLAALFSETPKKRWLR